MQQPSDTLPLFFMQYEEYPHRNNAAVCISVLNLHISQMKNGSQNLEQTHLIGLINTCRGHTNTSLGFYFHFFHTDFNLRVFLGVWVTQQGKSIACGAKLLGVIHSVDNGAAALPRVQEVICTAWIETQRGKHGTVSLTLCYLDTCATKTSATN